MTSNVRQPLTEDDFPAIEKEMQKIIELDEPFERVVQPREQAVKLCEDLKQEFKVEHIQTGLVRRRYTFVFTNKANSLICVEAHTYRPQNESARSSCSRSRVRIGKVIKPTPSYSASMRQRFSAKRIWTSIWPIKKKPKNVTTVCLANGSVCFTSTKWSVKA